MGGFPPVTSLLTLFMVLIFFRQGQSTSSEQSTSSPESLVQMFLNNFIHTHRFHLFLSLFSLHSYRSVEEKLGWKSYLNFICTITVIKTLIGP